MKTIHLSLILIFAIGITACSGEYYELQKSPCACNLDDFTEA